MHLLFALLLVIDTGRATNATVVGHYARYEQCVAQARRVQGNVQATFEWGGNARAICVPVNS